MMFNVILCAVLGYLLGTVNPAYLFGRLHGFDIRKYGSGNAGATNATLIMGKKTGFLCMLFDVFKAFAAYKTAVRIFPMIAFAGVLAGTACILGHIFPFWMHFAGGKGLACMLGMMLAHDWKLFAALLLAEIALVLLCGYICAMALSLSVIFPAAYLIGTGDFVGMLVLAVLIPVVIYKHMPNIRRIAQGKEMRISWLWNAKDEEARIEGNYSETEWKQRYKKVHPY